MFSEYPAILDLIHTVSIVQEIGILLFYTCTNILPLFEGWSTKAEWMVNLGGESGQPVRCRWPIFRGIFRNRRIVGQFFVASLFKGYKRPS